MGFPPGPGLAMLNSQSVEGLLVLRVAAIGVASTAVLGVLAFMGPRPVPSCVLLTLAFYHGAAFCLCLFPKSMEAFKGDVGGLVVHSGCFCLLLYVALVSPQRKKTS